jgi:protein-tyrosine phosphatase
MKGISLFMWDKKSDVFSTYMVVFDHIIDNIYLGDLEAVQNHKIMRKIDVVINVSEERYDEDHLKRYYHMRLTSDTMIDVIHKFNHIIEHTPKNSNILIHCVAGISRSVTLMLYYLMKYGKYHLKEAFTYLSHKRDQTTSPNYYLFRQLMTIEKIIYGINTLTYDECVDV